MLLHRPVALISTLVHSVMHEVLHLYIDRSDMPGGPAPEDLSTDLHGITTGFGILQLAKAEQMGWQGYLSQPSRTHAPALPPRATKYLKG